MTSYSILQSIGRFAISFSIFIENNNFIRLIHLFFHFLGTRGACGKSVKRVWVLGGVTCDPRFESHSCEFEFRSVQMIEATEW